MKKITMLLAALWLFVLIHGAHANNISVANVELTNQDLSNHYCIVEFDLGWYNSWKTSSIPHNWDAAWIFVKFRIGGGVWQHATLNPATSVSPAGGLLDFASDGKGVFISRDTDGSGAVGFSDVGLAWDYGLDGVADDASMQVQVFAIEMVYVPQGSFYLGDAASDDRFFGYNSSGATPFLVDGSSITLGYGASSLYALASYSSGVLGQVIPPTYPTGYNAFYCMKYEISQKQYVDFLNSLTRDQQNYRTEVDVSADAPAGGNNFVLTNKSVPYNRNGVACDASGHGTTDPITFYCDLNGNANGNQILDGQNIACSHVSWMDLAAYADWAGLRPMTEMEFEKVCRGPNTHVQNEYAWGTNVIHNNPYTFVNDGAPNETIDNMGTNIGNALTGDTDDNFLGPGRCGIFAASSANHSRNETGAAYYGAMELSGNVSELTVTLLYMAGLSFTGLHGDGEITANGNANTDYWPGINGNGSFYTANTAYSSSGVTDNGGMGDRGGAVQRLTFYSETSNRATVGTNTFCKDRGNHNGGRLVRTAP